MKQWRQTTLRDVLRLTWARFKIVTAVVGDMQGRAIAVLFYYVVAAPFGLLMRATSDPLRRKETPSWLVREPVDHQLDGAKRQG